MMRRTLGVLLAACLGCAGTVHAGEDAGTQSPFMLGAGSRAMAMGRAAVAVVQDATSLFWNPARLGAAPHAEIALFRTELFADGTLYHAGFAAYPTLDAGTLAIGYQRLDVSGIERRDDRNALLGTFDAGESNLLLGYGRRVGPLFAVGSTLRIVQQGVDDASAIGVGLDLGAALERRFGRHEQHRWSLGVDLVNVLEPKLRLVESDVPDPRLLRLGAGGSLVPTGGRLAYTAAADLDFPAGVAPRWGLGGEVVYGDLLALRSGLDDGHWTAGVGIAWRTVRFDYALRADDALSRNDRFTLALQLGSPLAERREARRAAREREVREQLARQLEEREAAEHQRALAEADRSFGGRRFDEAAKLYRRVLALDPNDGWAQARADSAEMEQALAAAEVLLRNGEAAQAATAFQAIEARWAGSVRGRAGLVEARTKLQRSADLERQLAGLFKNALTRFTDGDYLGAEIALAELLRLQPAHELGRELRERAHAARRARGQTHYDQARALAAAGDHASALRELAAAETHLGDTPELRKLAESWSAARRAAQQRPAVEATAPPVPRPAVRRPALSAEVRRELERRYEEGFAAFDAGDFERAIRNWRAVWVQDPGFENVGDNLIKAYLFEGIALYGSGKYAQALERCQRVLEIDPENDKALRYQRRIQEEKSELESIGGKRRE